MQRPSGDVLFLRMRQVLLASAPLLFALVALPTAAPAQERCQAVVDDNLAKLAIGASDVRRLQFSPTFEEDNDGNRRSTGTDVWVRLQSCEGALVIDLGRTCRVRQIYTRGACRLPGIKSFR